MAKVIVFNVPAHGHINPTLPLIKELIDQGEQVKYYAIDEFRDKIEMIGAEFATYMPPESTSVDAKLMGVDHTRPDPNLLRFSALMLKISLKLLPRLLKDVEDNKVDYIIHDSMSPWGKLVAKITKLPAICSTTTFAMDKQLLGGWVNKLKMMPTLITGIGGILQFRELTKEIKSQYNVEYTDMFEIFSNREDLTLVYTSRMFQPMIELYDKRFAFVGPSINLSQHSDQLPFKYDETRPLIYVSLGTLFNERVDFYKLCVQTFANTKYQVVMSLGKKVNLADLGELPANIFAFDSVPQLAVIKRASLFITHGGMNSVSEGIYFHVPLLIYPQTPEQALVANQAETLGAGVVLSEDMLVASRLLGLARRIIDNPKMLEATKVISNSFKEAGGYKQAVNEINRYKAAKGIK